MKKDWRDEAWKLYQQERANRWHMRILRRIAFSRWRRHLLTVSGWRILRRWNEDILDALYPDDCVIEFR